MVEMTPSERARKGYSLFLNRIANVKAADIAKEMGVSNATVSGLKNDHAENVILLMAHLGLKVVPADAACMPGDAFAFLTKTHRRVALADPKLLWGDGDMDSGWGGLS